MEEKNTSTDGRVCLSELWNHWICFHGTRCDHYAI